MARQLSSRERTLFTLLGLVGVITLWYLMSGEGALFGGPAPADAKETVSIGDPPVVNMSDLRAGGHVYDEQGRNLFQYHVPPPPRQVVQQPPRQVVQQPPRPIQPPPPPVEHGPVTPPIPQPDFAYIGMIGPKESKIAFFARGDELIPAEVGEVVDERFRVLEFKFDSVVLGYEDERFRGRTTELKMKPKPRK